MKIKRFNSIIVFLAFVWSLGIYAELNSMGKSQEGKEADDSIVFCAMDAKACPDGSYVSRDPAKNCEFRPCPTEKSSKNPFKPETCTDSELEVNTNCPTIKP